MPSFRCKIKKLRFQGILTEKETERILDALDMAEKTAEWRIVGKTTLHYECSACGGAGDKWDKFCKHCGRRMKGVEECQIPVEKQVKDLEEAGKWFLDGVIEGFNEQTEQNVGIYQQNVGEMSEKQTDGDLISRDFMKKLGATCIAKRSETGELVAISSIDNLPSAEKTTLSAEKTTITDTDLISKQAVIQALKDNVVEIGGEEYSGMGVCEEEIESIVNGVPSAEKTAEWINETEETIECGNCHHIFDDFGLLNGDQEKFYEYPNFCPNCGRKMIGVEMKGVE